MASENGQWIMRGIPADDPDCIRTAEKLEEVICETGFLPLFAGPVPGFSVEERTAPEDWWSGDEARDPWEWRRIIAGRGQVAYGKFFDGKAGFISREWFPLFANYRRDGYDFDARWDDGLANIRQKKVMDLFLEENGDCERFSPEVKELAGFHRGGEKNFEGTLTGLEMQTYLTVRDFRQRKSRAGEPYGWSIAVLCTPEHLFGRDLVTSRYREDPKASLEAIAGRVRQLFPEARDEDILRLVGVPGDRVRRKKELPYPMNFLHSLDPEIKKESCTRDALDGLDVALSQLNLKYQRVVNLRYREGKKLEEIGTLLRRSPGTISGYLTKVRRTLRRDRFAVWYREGYARGLSVLSRERGWDAPAPGEKISEEDLCLRLGIRIKIYEAMRGQGIVTVGDLLKRMADPLWYVPVPGIGAKIAGDIEEKVSRKGWKSRGADGTESGDTE